MSASVEAIEPVESQGEEKPKVSDILDRRSRKSSGPQDQDQALRERYMQRTLEKVYRLASRARWSWKDWLWLFLLGCILLVQIIQPAPEVNVDLTPVSDGQQALSQELSAMKKDLADLKGVLVRMQVIDSEIEESITEENLDPDVVPPDPVSLEENASGSQGDFIRLHTVEPGDTVSSIAQSYLGDSSSDMIEKLLNFNQITDASAVQVGDIVKIPMNGQGL